MPTPLSDSQLALMDAYWRAANYLTVGQIYLRGQSAAARAAAGRAHQAAPARPLGNFARTEFHLRAPEPADPRHDADVIYLSGPGHGGPARLSQRVSRRHVLGDLSARSRGRRGLRRLFRQFSTPGGIPSHAGPHVPARSTRAASSATPRARLRRRVRQSGSDRRVRGRRRRGRDRSARGLLEGRQVPQPGPRRRGAPDPAPERIQDLRAHGARPRRDDDDPRASRGSRLRSSLRRGRRAARGCIGRSPRPSTHATRQFARSRTKRAHDGLHELPRWPAIVLRTPKGWTGPKVVDGLPIEGPSARIRCRCRT